MAQSADAIVKECNEECQKCKMDFDKDGIEFSPSMCKFCDNGQKLHKALCQTSEAEKAWDKTDWNSSKYKDLYKG